MVEKRLKTACRVILSIWLVIKLIGAFVTYLSLGAVDLTVLNPAIELGFQTFVFFIKSSSAGLAVFIALIAVSVFSSALGFFVVPDDRMRNIVGFFAYAVMLLTDTASAVILGSVSDGLFYLLLLFELPAVLCLILFGRAVFQKNHITAAAKSGSDGEDDENNA